LKFENVLSGNFILLITITIKITIAVERK
jgi:hypothetical protein